MNRAQSATMRALELAKILDVEHTSDQLHVAFRAIRHEIRTLRDLLCPQATPEAKVELRSAHTGRRTAPGSLRHHILGMLNIEPLADFQIRHHLSLGRHDGPEWPRVGQVRRRRHELVAAGWVEAVLLGTGVRKVVQHETGRECTVYQLTDLGAKALSRLRSGQEALFTDRELGNGSDTTPDNPRGSDVSPT